MHFKKQQLGTKPFFKARLQELNQQKNVLNGNILFYAGGGKDIQHACNYTVYMAWEHC